MDTHVDPGPRVGSSPRGGGGSPTFVAHPRARERAFAFSTERDRGFASSIARARCVGLARRRRVLFLERLILERLTEEELRLHPRERNASCPCSWVCSPARTSPSCATIKSPSRHSDGERQMRGALDGSMPESRPMSSMHRLASALAAVLLLACGSDYVQPPSPISPTPAGDGGAGTVTPVLRPDGALTLATEASVVAIAGRDTRVHAFVGGGAGPYSVSWRQLGGPPAAIFRGDSLEPTIRPPLVPEPTDLPFIVTVVDATGAFQSTNTTLSIARSALAIVASSRTVEDAQGTTIHAVVSGNLDGLSFVWTQTKGAPVVIQSPTSQTTRITLPFIAADATVELEARATNGDGQLVKAVATIDVRPNGPHGYAGASQVAAGGAPASLRGDARDGTPPYT